MCLFKLKTVLGLRREYKILIKDNIKFLIIKDFICLFKLETVIRLV